MKTLQHSFGQIAWSVLAFVVAALLPVLSKPIHASTIDWVTVGNPGNAKDTTGYGAVANSYQIMKYEYTNADYVTFLNASDPTGANTYGTYSSLMGDDGRGGISYTSGNAAGSKYAVRPNMSDKPVNFVTWFDAARVSNWMHNNQGSGSTETGAYTLLGGQTTGTAPAANADARFYIPTEDQWYKAAYYTGTGSAYTTYGNGYSSTPTAVTADSTGIGSAGSTGNFANYDKGAVWNGQTGNVTTVGTNGGPSSYGAFDMSGNAYEWNDLDNTPGSFRGLRGGAWSLRLPFLPSTWRGTGDPSFEAPHIGFRLASSVSGPSAVPEIDPTGMGSVIALFTGALGLQERRRLKVKWAA